MYYMYMKLKQVIGALILALVAGVGVWGATQLVSQDPSQTDKPTVITTLYPLYDTAAALAGDSAEVSLLLDPGTDIHGFEPSPSDIVAISEADLFIYSGDDLEPWAADLLAGLDSDVKVVNTSEGIDLIEFKGESHDHDHADDHDKKDDHGHDHDHEHDDHMHEEHGDHDHSHDEDHAHEEEGDDHSHDHDHDHSGLDPHYWLDFENAQIMTNTIKDALVEVLPDNSAEIDSRAQERIEALQALDTRYETELGSCSTRSFVHGGHYAFGYLAERYDLEYESAQGFSSNSEPTAQTIANLVESIEEADAQAVFTEELIEPRVAEIISEETGVPVLKLHGAHNISAEEFESEVSFLSLMESNLENLKVGLGCE